MVKFAKPVAFAGAVLAAVTLTAAPATAQESSLERRLDGINDTFDQRFAALEQQLGYLTALVERLERSQNEYSRETLGLIDEISRRLSEIQAASHQMIIATGPDEDDDGDSLGVLHIPAEPDTAVAIANGIVVDEVDTRDLLIDDLLDAVGGGAAEEASMQGPVELYAAARNLLTEYRWDEAIEAFNEFLEHNAEHELAGEAKYWLGEAYYGTENYNQAAATFLGLVKDHRDSDRLASSWLRVGMSLYHTGNSTAACQAYGEAAKYAGAAREDRERLQRERARAQCA